MRLVRKRKRRADPTWNARVLVLERDPGKLDRIAGVLRAGGFKVVALGNPDALVALSQVFKPELAIIGVAERDEESFRIGRRIHRKFRGSVPVLYLAEQPDAELQRIAIEVGAGLDLLPREDAQAWMLRTRAILSFRAAVTERMHREFEARSPSMHDDVTGLYNRRFLLEMVAAEARRGERYGGSFSVVMAELDEFMAFRDRFGEEICDRLMVYSSVLLRQASREADVVARVGRYHFAMLLPGMASEALPGFLDRLRRRFALARFQVEGSSHRASMTFGCASFPDVVGPAQQIFAKAIQDLDRSRDETRAGPPRAAV